MQTDLILKRLTELYAADILSLFGLPVAEVLSVETLEMAANAARLDNLVKVRSPQGQEYWHIIEWQGYRDPTILWRVLGYVVRTGQRNPQVAITASIVYLTPECDMGDTIRHEVDGRLLWTWQVQALRMWQQDAPTLLASNRPGLAP